MTENNKFGIISSNLFVKCREYPFYVMRLKATFSGSILKLFYCAISSIDGISLREEIVLRIFQMDNGDQVHRYQRSIVVSLKGKRNVLSTSPLNGGYRDDLKTVFNNNFNPETGYELRAPTYREHMILIAEELGLNPDFSAGLSTAASMENAAIEVEKFRDIILTAIVTGGIEVNAGRVGDPASFYERGGKVEAKYNARGTINIILDINVNLNASTLTRALVTCTEAKTAALQELMVSSKYSTGLATGSGTDGTILISNLDSPINMTYAGKHSKLGELIGIVVKKAVKKAIARQSNLTPEVQHSFLRRTKRYGIDEESLWHRYIEQYSDIEFDKENFIHLIHLIDRDDMLLTLSSLYVHLLDQLQWKLLGVREVMEAARDILLLIGKKLSLQTVGETSLPVSLEKQIKSKNFAGAFQDLIISFIIFNKGVK